MVALGVGLALRLMYFIGLSGHDDVSYFNYALDVLEGTFGTEPAADGSFPFRFRLGIILPTALMFSVFGVSEQVAAILPLLNSLGLIWMCWWGGRRISPQVGFYAALLMATFPLAIGTATSLLPSPFTALCAGVSILFWLDTRSAQQAGRLSPRQAAWRSFAAGVVLGLGYFFRIEAGLFVLFFVSFAALQRETWKNCLLALCGAASVVLLENIAYFLLHGELLYRLKVISGGFSDLDAELSEAILTRKSPWVYLKYIFLKPTDLGLHWAALVPCALLAVIWRKAERQPVLLWFWPVTLYLFFGSWSLSTYVPTTKDPRYLMIVTPPGLILLAAMLEQISQRSGRDRLVRRLVLSGVMVGSLVLVNLVFAYRSENASGSRVAARYLAAAEDNADAPDAVRSGPIWCEHHAALALRCFLPHREIIPVSEHDLGIGQTVICKSLEDLSDRGVVFVDTFLIDKYVAYSAMAVPDYLLAPPEQWCILFEAPHPTSGLAYGVVSALNAVLQGRVEGPQRSLRQDPVFVYRPSAE